MTARGFSGSIAGCRCHQFRSPISPTTDPAMAPRPLVHQIMASLVSPSLLALEGQPLVVHGPRQAGLAAVQSTW